MFYNVMLVYLFCLFLVYVVISASFSISYHKFYCNTFRNYPKHVQHCLRIGKKVYTPEGSQLCEGCPGGKKCVPKNDGKWKPIEDCPAGTFSAFGGNAFQYTRPEMLVICNIDTGRTLLVKD